LNVFEVRKVVAKRDHGYFGYYRLWSVVKFKLRPSFLTDTILTECFNVFAMFINEKSRNVFHDIRVSGEIRDGALKMQEWKMRE